MARDPKFLLSIVMVVIMMVAWMTRNGWLNLLPIRWIGILFTLLIISRIAVLFLAFAVGGRVSGNTSLLWDAVEHIKQGEVVFRDFGSPIATPYNPPFYYTLQIFSDEFQLSLVLSLFEVASFIAFFWLLMPALNVMQLRLWSVMYLLSPLGLWWGGVGGQTHAPIILLCVFAVMLLVAGRIRFNDFLSGLLLGIGFSFTKLTLLVAVPFTLSFSRRMIYSALGFILGILIFVPVYVYSWANYSAYILSASANRVPPTTWNILNVLTGGLIPETSALYSPLALIACWFIGLWSFIRLHKTHGVRTKNETLMVFASGWCLVWATFCLLTPVGQSNYFMFWLAPSLLLLVLSPNSRFLISAVLILNLIANVQGSIYYTDSSINLRDFSNPTAFVLFVLNTLILLSYAVIGFYALKRFLNPALSLN